MILRNRLRYLAGQSRKSAFGAVSLTANAVKLVTTWRRIASMINEKPRYFAPVNWRNVVIWCAMAGLTFGTICFFVEVVLR